MKLPAVRQSKDVLSYCVYIYMLIYISTINFWLLTSGKNNIERLIFFGLLIGTTLLSILKSLLKKRMNVLLILLLGYFVVCIILSIFATNLSFGSLYPYIILPCFIFTTYYFRDRIDTNKLIVITVIICSIVALLCNYEFFTHSYVLDSPTNKYRAFRPQVFADSPLSMGCQMAISSILSFGLYKEEKKKLYLFTCIISFTALLFTQSRGPLVGWLIGMYVFYAIDMNRKKQFSKNMILILVVALIAILGVLFLSLGIIEIKSSNVIISRVFSTFNWTSDEGNLGRLYKWKIYLSEFIQMPIFGKGIGYIDNSPYGVTESGFLQQLVETGLVGILVYYYIVLNIITKGIKIVNSFGEYSYIYLGIVSSCICVVIYNTVFQIFDNTINGFLFWMMLGLLINASELSNCMPPKK